MPSVRPSVRMHKRHKTHRSSAKKFPFLFFRPRQILTQRSQSQIDFSFWGISTSIVEETTMRCHGSIAMFRPKVPSLYAVSGWWSSFQCLSRSFEIREKQREWKNRTQVCIMRLMWTIRPGKVQNDDSQTDCLHWLLPFSLRIKDQSWRSFHSSFETQKKITFIPIGFFLWFLSLILYETTYN